MSDRERLQEYVEIWHREAEDFTRLARSLTEEQGALPTDLAGWSVKDNVAHTAHLESVLAGGPEETVEVSEQAHIKSITGWYTEQGVVARRDRTLSELADEIDDAVAARYAALQADPPVDGAAAPPKTPGDIGWNNATLLSNRPLDIWMHEQDIRRAVDQPGGYDSAAAAHAVGVFAKALPMVLGKRVGAPAGTSVVLDVDGLAIGAVVGEDGRASGRVSGDPDVRVSLATEDFIVLAGGRRTVAQTAPTFEGDEDLGRKVLDALAVTP